MTERFTTTVTFEGKPIEVCIGKREKTYYQTYCSIHITVWRYHTPMSGFLYFTKSGKFVKYMAVDLLTERSYAIPRVQLKKEIIEFFESCIAASFNNNQAKEATL